jgi:hypothetical protein
MANRWGIPKEVEDLVIKRDLRCIYCGCEFTESKVSYKSRPTWEHIINDIRINGAENVGLCCGSCNASKGPKRLEDWLKSKYCINKGITVETVSPTVKLYLERIKQKA